MISKWILDTTHRALTKDLKHGDRVLGRTVSHVSGRKIHFTDGTVETDVGDPIEPWYLDRA